MTSNGSSTLDPDQDATKISSSSSTPDTLKNSEAETKPLDPIEPETTQEFPPPDLDTISAAFYDIITAVGENPDRPGMKKTPNRAAEAMIFYTSGYRQDLEEIVNDALFPCDTRELIMVRDIELYSLCEHHLVPFFGKAHVAYIPDGKVIGLSKLARIVEMYSRRFQIQERLTSQIATAINSTVSPLGVAVVLECSHMCMISRGVQKPESSTITSSMLGVFRQDPKTRAEFMTFVQLQKK